jgi:hypothetical protein
MLIYRNAQGQRVPTNRTPPEGVQVEGRHNAMEPDATYVYTLARALGALLPHRLIGQPPAEPVREAFPLMQRLEDACYTAGLHALDAVVIADTLGSYLLGGTGRLEAPIAAEIARATAVLNYISGGRGVDAGMELPPAGTVLSDHAIARFLAWRLMVELPEE